MAIKIDETRKDLLVVHDLKKYFPVRSGLLQRVSAWVRADEREKISLSLALNHYNGPAMYSSRTPIVSTGRGSDAGQKDGAWRRLEFVSAPSGSSTISGGFRFAYSGRGAAALSEFAVERL